MRFAPYQWNYAGAVKRFRALRTLKAYEANGGVIHSEAVTPDGLAYLMGCSIPAAMSLLTYLARKQMIIVHQSKRGGGYVTISDEGNAALNRLSDIEV